MFRPSDFEIPLEKQLRLRVIEKEIDECRDVDELKSQLKQCVKQLANYQHLLGKACEYNLEAFMTDWLSTMGIETETKPDA
tara:strand:- start:212 stop:454 length:243 start_codon:yes stop_codon:yes gene_type:complete